MKKNYQNIGWTRLLDSSTGRTFRVDLEVDVLQVLEQLGLKAFRNDSGRSQICGGAIRVKTTLEAK